MNPDISVVIVHWNVPQLLRRCLASLWAEERRAGLSLQVIVADSASDVRVPTDLATSPTIELVQLDANRGYGAGANAGIARANGAAVLILNADTELLPDSLCRLWTTLHVSSHVGLTAPLLLNTDGTLQSHGYRFPGLANVVFDLLPVHPRIVESPLNGRVRLGDGVQPVRIDYPLGAAMLVRHDALRQVGGFDESYVMYSEEIDLARRLAERGWSSLLVPSARVIHHGGQSTRQRPGAMREALWESRARYFERWGSPWQRRLLPSVVALGTRLRDLRASDAEREAHARVRERFRRLGAAT